MPSILAPAPFTTKYVGSMGLGQLDHANGGHEPPDTFHDRPLKGVPHLNQCAGRSAGAYGELVLQGFSPQVEPPPPCL